MNKNHNKTFCVKSNQNCEIKMALRWMSHRPDSNDNHFVYCFQFTGSPRVTAGTQERKYNIYLFFVISNFSFGISPLIKASKSAEDNICVYFSINTFHLRIEKIGKISLTVSETFPRKFYSSCQVPKIFLQKLWYLFFFYNSS